jgi:hypothetical protein
MAPSRQLSAYDQVMWDGPFTPDVANGMPLVISVAFFFDALPSDAEIHRMVRERLLSFDTFSSVARGGRWVACESIEMAKHVMHSGVRGEAALLAFFEDKMGAPMADPDGPRWEIHVVSNHGAGRSAMLCRVHHALGDGIGMSTVMDAIATSPKGAPIAPKQYSRPPPRSRPSCLAALTRCLSGFAKSACIPIGPFDAPFPFAPADRAQLRGGARKLTAVPVHSLELVKKIKSAANGTVNDVVYAAFAGALRRYTQQTSPGADLDARCRALCPLAFPRDAGAPLTNDWTFVQTDVPVGGATPAERFRATHEIFERIKGSPEPLIGKCLVAMNASGPLPMARMVSRDTFARHRSSSRTCPAPRRACASPARRSSGSCRCTRTC